MPDGSTGDVAADEYHHYKVTSITAVCGNKDVIVI